MTKDKAIVGGGTKKVLYTLRTAQRMGLLNSAKALTAKNTCKACALGMGGQRGGMTNERGEFPSVCNKSVQAQSTDIQPPIPAEVFTHSLSELQELSAHEMERLGRLGSPIYKAPNADHFTLVDWDAALNLAARHLQASDPDRTFFYASGRASNEAGFILQLLARLHGSNNVNNCSYYCHQATSVALGGMIGTGTATIELDDLSGCDLIFVIGANPASNHPRFIHKLKACRDRGGQVIVINPAREPGLVKFAIPKNPASLLKGGDEIASQYVQPKIGGDIALLSGIAKSVIEQGGTADNFVDAHTNAFTDFKQHLDTLSWSDLENQSGVTQAEIAQIASLYIKSQSAVLAWGMGITHHTHGVENVEAIVNLALLRGMIGRPAAGLLPLRGHSNVQGIGTIGVKPVLADDVFKKMEKVLGVSLPTKPGMDTMAAMQAAHRGDVDTALMMGGNLYASNPNSQFADEALAKIGFKIYMTTTLNQGHVNGTGEGGCLILPVTARDEEFEPTTQESMFNYVRLSDGGVRRIANARPESAILANLAQRLFKDSPIDFSAFGKHQKVREAIAKIIPGMEGLADIEEAKREFHIRNRVLHTPNFQTPSRRATFKPVPLPTTTETDAPFRMATIRSEGQFNSIIYEEADSYRGTETRWSVMMNVDDMEDLGVSIGDHVDLKSTTGKMKAVRVYPFDLPRGNITTYYPEANILTSTDIDPRSLTPSFKSTGVWIEKSVETQAQSS